MILGLRLGRLRLGGPRIEDLAEGAVLAEQAGLDFVHLAAAADGSIGGDPLSVAAYLMTKTRRMGLVASIPTSWAPFNVARALASFDLLSGGRCGWLPLIDDPDTDPAREAEHLDVVLQLFDSWDDDTLVLDKAASVFADSGKVRRIQHEGVYFSVDGPLNAPRPPQGWPVLMQPLGALSAVADIALIALDQLDATRPPTGSARLLAVTQVDARHHASGGAALREHLVQAYSDGRCDGFVFESVEPLIDIPLLADEVIPVLRALDPAPSAAGQGDFRARIGLPRPVNRFTTPTRAETFQ